MAYLTILRTFLPTEHPYKRMVRCRFSFGRLFFHHTSTRITAFYENSPVICEAILFEISLYGEKKDVQRKMSIPTAGRTQDKQQNGQTKWTTDHTLIWVFSGCNICFTERKYFLLAAIGHPYNGLA